MQSVDQDTRKNRMYAAAASALYVVGLVLLLLLLTVRIDVLDNAGEGLLINFGNTETGLGDTDLVASDETASAASASQAASQQSSAEVLTQDTEEAPAIPADPRPTRQPITQPTPPQPTQADNPPVEQPRQVDQRALFPGRTAGSSSTSEGTAGGTGNQGNPAGDPAGSHDGTGTGNSGNFASLAGRSLVGSLPVPAYTAREEGRVVIEVHVDQQGRVTRTVFRSVGSTTTNATLVAAAERAARQARFNTDESAALTQIGTITYNFRMR